jgi:hypothetical protein
MLEMTMKNAELLAHLVDLIPVELLRRRTREDRLDSERVRVSGAEDAGSTRVIAIAVLADGIGVGLSGEGIVSRQRRTPEIWRTGTPDELIDDHSEADLRAAIATAMRTGRRPGPETSVSRRPHALAWTTPALVSEHLPAQP